MLEGKWTTAWTKAKGWIAERYPVGAVLRRTYEGKVQVRKIDDKKEGMVLLKDADGLFYFPDPVELAFWEVVPVEEGKALWSTLLFERRVVRGSE